MRTKLETILFENRISLKRLSDKIAEYYTPSIHPVMLSKITKGDRDSLKSTYFRICVALTDLLGRLVTPNDIMEFESEFDEMLDAEFLKELKEKQKS